MRNTYLSMFVIALRSSLHYATFHRIFFQTFKSLLLILELPRHRETMQLMETFTSIACPAFCYREARDHLDFDTRSSSLSTIEPVGVPFLFSLALPSLLSPFLPIPFFVFPLFLLSFLFTVFLLHISSLLSVHPFLFLKFLAVLN